MSDSKSSSKWTVFNGVGVFLGISTVAAVANYAYRYLQAKKPKQIPMLTPKTNLFGSITLSKSTEDVTNIERPILIKILDWVVMEMENVSENMLEKMEKEKMNNWRRTEEFELLAGNVNAKVSDMFGVGVTSIEEAVEKIGRNDAEIQERLNRLEKIHKKFFTEDHDFKSYDKEIGDMLLNFYRDNESLTKCVVDEATAKITAGVLTDESAVDYIRNKVIPLHNELLLKYKLTKDTLDAKTRVASLNPNFVIELQKALKVSQT